MPAIVTPDNAQRMAAMVLAERKKRADVEELKNKAARDLREFVQQAWHVIEPATPFVGGWNLDAVCDHLQAVSRGEIRNLVINVPPRTSKSTIVSVLWPAWAWINKPELRWLFSSYTSKLSLRDSMKCRRVIDSKWYRNNWGHIYHLIGDQNTKENYENDKTGQRIATSVSGIGVGAGGDVICCLSGDTLIETDGGAIPIQVIVDQKLPVRVLSYNHEWVGSEFRDIEAYEPSAGRESVRITFSGGTWVDSTTDHPFFVDGIGYVKAIELKQGNRVLHADQVSSLPERVLSIAGACGQVEKGHNGLQQQVFRGISARPEQFSVSHRENSEVLRELQGGVLCEAVRHKEAECLVLLDDLQEQGYGRSSAPEIFSNKEELRGMRVGNNQPPLLRRPREVLYQGMRESSASKADQGKSEPAMGSWRIREALLGGILRNSPENSDSGWLSMSSLWNSARAWCARVRCSSHRLRDGAQLRIESDNYVQDLPWGMSRDAQESGAMATTAVVSVEPIATPGRVFNIRVAGNHNYFANGILVHNCDDPNSVEMVESDVMRQNVLDWWDHTMSTRGNDPKTVSRVVVQQRLHEQDLSGHVLAQGGYTHLFLPMRFEEKRRCRTVVGAKPWEDPREKHGDLLWPERFGEKEIVELETRLGSYMSAGQLQQNPAPAGGGILKSFWWRYWQPAGAKMDPVPVSMPDGSTKLVNAIELPSKFDLVLSSWDMAFKDLATSDYVVGVVMAARGANRFILDLDRGHYDLPKTLLAVRKMSAKHREAYTKLVEDKANGPAVIQSLHATLGGFVAVNPIGGKISRAAAESPTVESGNWYLPHPLLADWVAGFIEEAAAFPKAAHDDQVDAWSMGAARLKHVTPLEDEDTEFALSIQDRKLGGWSA